MPNPKAKPVNPYTEVETEREAEISKMTNVLFERILEKNTIEEFEDFLLSPYTGVDLDYEKNRCVDGGIQFVIILKASYPIQRAYHLGINWAEKQSFFRWRRENNKQTN